MQRRIPERNQQLQITQARRTEPDGKMLYIMRDALSSFNDESQQLEAMVPPCIIPAGDGSVQVPSSRPPPPSSACLRRAGVR